MHKKCGPLDAAIWMPLYLVVPRALRPRLWRLWLADYRMYLTRQCQYLHRWVVLFGLARMVLANSKLANQTIVAVTIGVVAEAMLLAEKGGADPAAIRDALKGGFADSVILQQHGERMTTGNFVPGGLTKFQLKDINNSLEEAGHHNLTLPLTEQVQHRYTTLVEEMDGADTDHSAIYLNCFDKITCNGQIICSG